jgi:hypothetical protein
MKSGFNFNLFRVTFVETDKTSKFESLIAELNKN